MRGQLRLGIRLGVLHQQVNGRAYHFCEHNGWEGLPAPSGRFLYVANTTDGTVSTITLNRSTGYSTSVVTLSYTGVFGLTTQRFPCVSQRPKLVTAFLINQLIGSPA